MVDDPVQVSAAFFASRPEHERPRALGIEPVPGTTGLSAEACGTCHTEIYLDWKGSVHAAAYVDPQLQEEMKKSENRWLCLGCHTPLMSQFEQLPVDLIDGDVEQPVWVANPSFDASLRSEGVTCAGCHVRDGVIIGPGLPDSAPPHPVRVDPRFRDPAAVCVECHQAMVSYEGKNFLCTFDTGNEWSGSSAAARGEGCVSCHMPVVERPAAVGGPIRRVAQHGWPGSGLMKLPDQAPRVAIEPGLTLDTRVEDGVLVVQLGNRSGHHLPTGDPERWVQVDVQPLGKDGGLLGEPQSLRIGQRWEWEPTPRKLDDNRLAADEARAWRVSMPPGTARVQVVASSHRMSEDTAAYHHLLGRYPISRETHRLVVEVP